jgi:hypothetical protein
MSGFSLDRYNLGVQKGCKQSGRLVAPHSLQDKPAPKYFLQLNLFADQLGLIGTGLSVNLSFNYYSNRRCMDRVDPEKSKCIT